MPSFAFTARVRIVFGALLCLAVAASVEARPRPSILVVTVDTLRADHLSSYGYERPTSPAIDALMDRGAKFTQARTVQTFTGPSLCSMWTSLHPHEHGASRNALAMRDDLPSVSKILGRRGWRTAGFVSNWLLRDEHSNLAEHFDHYEGVFTRKQWFILRREAEAADVTDATLDWIEEHRESEPLRPFLVWAHYIDPHAPYRLREEHVRRLGIPPGERKIDRYDTEIAETDAQIGRLLDGVAERVAGEDLIVFFSSDHGEAFGEHGLWGHGKHLYEPTLHIPLGFTWEGHIAPGAVVSEPAMLFDLGPTLLGLVELPVPDTFRGFDWSGVLLRGELPPQDRVTWHQAHKGLVHIKRDSEEPRRKGLLEVGLVRNGRKELFRVEPGRHRLFDLTSDPAETDDLSAPDAEPSDALLEWMATVYAGLDALGRMPVDELDAESVEQLRALGYLD